MEELWQLKFTDNINQMLRVRNDVDIKNELKNFTHLVTIKHKYHASDDIMFPDPACLAFFTAFEQNHLKALEESNSLKLVAVDIHEGLMQYFLLSNDAMKTINDSISFLKSNSLYSCDFEIAFEKKDELISSMY
ncbi:DUF695 domain-containing protein [Arcobacter sp. YIC-464]|uniref:DUF695 domain-containing protein n=1 Tax=Arcobacter sp. YIC-464 TaxID=3376631 RepID=UPI003C19D5FF